MAAQRISLSELFYDKLAELKTGRIALFCGAGISRNSGLPLATQMTRHCLEKLGASSEFNREIHDKEVPFEGIMEVFVKNSDPEYLFRVFELGEPNTNHFLIAKLARLGFLKVVVTTNFDQLIEKALLVEGMQEGIDYTVIKNHQEYADINWESGKLLLIKIHGSIDEKLELGITLEMVSSQSLSAIRNPVISQLFSEGSHEKVLILGYSCSDAFDISPYLEYLPGPHKEVLLIDHSSETGKDALAEPVRDQFRKNPFRQFSSGTRIRCSTDELVRTIWEETVKAEPYQVIRHDLGGAWEQLAEKWVERQTDTDRNFILAGLATFIGRHDLAEQHYKQNLADPANGIGTSAWLTSNSNLATSYMYQGKFEESVELSIQAINLFRAIQDWSRAGNQLGWLGNTYLQTGEFKKAIDTYTEAIELLKKANDLRGVGNQLGNLGNTYFKMGEVEKAKDYWVKALSIAEETGNIKGQLNQYVMMSQALLNDLQFEEAIAWLEKGKQLAGLLGSKEEETRLFKNLAYAYQYSGNYTKALNYLEQALGIAKEENNAWSEAEITALVGGFYVSSGQFVKAAESYEIAFKSADWLDADEIRADSLKGLAEVNFHLGNYTEGLRQIDAAIELARANSLESIEITGLTAKANALLNMADPDGAIRAYLEVMDIRKNNGTISKASNDYGNLALAYFEKENYEKGLETVLAGLELAEKEGNVPQIGFCSGVAGMGWFYRKDFQKAIEYQKKSFDIALRSNDYYRQMILLGEMALVEMENANFFTAKKYYSESYQLAEQTGNTIWQALRLYDLGNLFSMMGYYLLGLRYWENAMVFFHRFDPPDQAYIRDTYERIQKAEALLRRRGDIEQYDHWKGSDVQLQMPFLPKEAEKYHEAVLNAEKIELQSIRDMAFWHYEMKNHRKALELFDIYLSYKPDDQVALNRAANAAYTSGEKEPAFRYFSSLYKQDPSHVNANYMLGHLFNKFEKWDESRFHYRVAIQENPDHVNALYNLAMLMMDDGQYQEAKRHLEHVIRLSPQDGDALFKLGHIATLENDYHSAATFFESCVRVDPGQKSAWLVLGLIYDSEILDYEKAAQCLSTYLEKEPKDVEMLEKLAVIYIERLQNDRMALEYFHRLLELKPDDPETLNTIAVIYHDRLQIPGMAQNYYERLMAINPSFPRLNYHFALLISEFHEKYEEAVSYYEKELSVHPDFYPAHHNLGLLWSTRLNDPERGKFHYETALEINPTFGKTHWKLGELLISAFEDYEAGCRHLQQALETEPDNLDAAHKLVDTLIEVLDRCKEAEEICRGLLEKDDSKAWIWLLLGHSVIRQGDRKEEGLSCFRRSFELNRKLMEVFLQDDSLDIVLSPGERKAFTTEFTNGRQMR